MGYQGWGCRGEVSVTTCNEICREHFTVAAVVYCRKLNDLGSVQTNPAAGNKKQHKSSAVFVAATEFTGADCITNSTESSARNATGLQAVIFN